MWIWIPLPVNHVVHVFFFLLHRLGHSNKVSTILFTILLCGGQIILHVVADLWSNSFLCFSLISFLSFLVLFYCVPGDSLPVEKAALVFSLKLDTGHKLLCPWVDNICDEKLAEFPPKPTTVLVDDYKKRCSALLQLSALPIISPSAIDYIRSPQLEQFFGGPSGAEKNKSADASRSLINNPPSASSASYYQVQTLRMQVMHL